ncbi:MAG: sigma 54-interacting transcriptional regulator, partial [Pseudomonadota bacterium]|nr:sigma 54-interacting transcriptional regulator [Pseudomonadota bacterium]
MAHILIVDDESAFTSGIAQFLRRRSHDVSVANTLSGARGLLRERIPEYLLLDLMLPDGSGLELLDAFEQHRPNKIIIITGNSGVKTLIAGMAGERVAYLTKPVEPRDLLGLLDTTDIDVPPQELDESMHFGVLLGESRPMQDIYSKIRQVGPTDSTVFIQGESGTGKELVAEAVHRTSRRRGAFVPVNCGGLAQDLVSTQLFGHEKGSFTGATKRHI